jgi:hypothetical protein
MRNLRCVTVVCAAFLLTCGTSPELTGTGSETDTAMIYNPDNTPAVGAVVRFFVVTDTTRTIAYQTITDANGHYPITGLAKGAYNMLASKDTLIVFQDSILVLSDTVLVKPDTLQKAGSVTGIVGIQPNHDPRTVTVQVLGTDLYSNVDINGRFTLAPVARGSYNLRLVTTLLNYTPTYKTIQTAGQKKDTLSDTLWLLYTGIPVVMGLAATYDTVNGVVRLSWNKAAYRDFQDYLIFRDAYDSIVLSASPIAARGDTFFVDSVYKRNLGSGQFSFSDTNDYHFKYRICIENNSSVRGEKYKYIDIVAASPRKVTTSFVFTFFHVAKQFVTDSASVNDSLMCSVKLANPTRQLRSLVWNDIVTGKTVRTVALDSTKKTAGDSLVYSWNSVGDKGLECVVTDMAGIVWKDTARISIVKDAPVVKIANLPASIVANDTIHFHVTATDKYGKIAKVEWDVGNTGLFATGARVDSVIDTVLIAPGVPETRYLYVVRVTDDDGNVVLDTVVINVTIFGLATDSAGFGERWGHSSVVFNNKMWVIGGIDSASFIKWDTWYSDNGILWYSSSTQQGWVRAGHTSIVFNNMIWLIGGYSLMSLYNDVWSASDGTKWTQRTSAAAFSPRYGHTSLLFNNRMWVIGGGGLGLNYNDVWYSVDGVTWLQATANAGFSPRYYHSSVVFGNKMWVIGGQQNTFYNDVWYSVDGVAWIQATANAGFSPRSGHSSVVFDNKMWVIAGQDSSGTFLNDAWYSTDGVAWYQAAANAEFSPRDGHSSITFDNKMWIIGGRKPVNNAGLKDVWYSKF